MLTRSPCRIPDEILEKFLVDKKFLIARNLKNYQHLSWRISGEQFNGFLSRQEHSRKLQDSGEIFVRSIT